MKKNNYILFCALLITTCGSPEKKTYRKKTQSNPSAATDANKVGKPNSQTANPELPQTNEENQNTTPEIEKPNTNISQHDSYNLNVGRDEDANKYNYTCEEIGRSPDDGFFSLEVYKDKLYVGGFGYNKKDTLFRYPQWETATPGLITTESICEMQEFKGQLYAATEQDGYIYRSTDGTNWTKVFDDKGAIACSLGVYKDHLYAQIHQNGGGFGGIIYRTPDGTNWKPVRSTYNADQEDYIKDLYPFNGTLYAFYVNYKDNGKGGYLTTTDGKNWVKHPQGTTRLLKGLNWNGEFWATHSPFPDNPGNMAVNDGVLFVPVSVKWKGFGGGAGLMISRDKGQTFTKACNFTETESWNTIVFKNDVYVTTKQHGSGKGRMFKVVKTPQ